MRNYSIAIANNYNTINSPLIIEAGYYNTKFSGYKCITKLEREDYYIIPYSPELENVNNITVMAKVENSYSVFLHDDSQSDNPPIQFNFYAWQDIYDMNINTLNFILSQELPSLYKETNILNSADNAGITAVLLEVYATLYLLFYNSTSSLGVEKSYNENWEYIYIGINKILQNAVYPAEFLKTLIRIKTQTSTQSFSIAILVTRLIYQLTGNPVPVEVVYDEDFTGYNINIYNKIIDTWILEDSGSSELEDTTFLLGFANGFIWLLTLIIMRVMPAFVKWRIQYLPISDFNDNFNVDEVFPEDYYDPTILYNAYMVTNNHNNFNTKGYIYG